MKSHEKGLTQEDVFRGFLPKKNRDRLSDN